jgi:hypothetical protein
MQSKPNKLKRVREEAATVTVPHNLVDGGHVLLSCSNCDAILADLYLTKPNVPRFNYKANCPFCGDTSFVKDVAGVGHMGGYGKVKEDNEDDDVASTLFDGFEIVDDVVVLKIRKATPDAKPIRKR